MEEKKISERDQLPLQMTSDGSVSIGLGMPYKGAGVFPFKWCDHCHLPCDTRKKTVLHCEQCDNFDLCIDYYRKNGHNREHKMVKLVWDGIDSDEDDH